jgi:GNAT superfamily N-acetyltransferase
MGYKRLHQNNYKEAGKIYDEIFPDRFNFETEWKSMLKYGRVYGYYNNENCLISFCSWVYYSDDPYITLCNLTVNNSFHRKGYGKKMVKYIINQIKRRNKEIIVLTNEKEFFENCNFKIFEDFEDDELQPYRYIMKYEINI